MRNGITKADLDLLLAVDELGRSGITQTEIARRLGFKSPSALHRRVNRTGCRLESTPVSRVMVSLTGKPLADAVATGEVLA